MAFNYRDVLLYLTVKNDKGSTFHDISSLDFDFKVRLLLKPMYIKHSMLVFGFPNANDALLVVLC